MLSGQPCSEVAIDLDDREALEAFEQRAGERAQPGPDLDDVVIRLRIERSDDALDVMPVDQEMLAEALACKVVASASSSLGRTQGIVARR
jgi:hypothetical protein